MRIETRYRPELACSKDRWRETLQRPYLLWAKEMAFLVATNGRMLVHVPVTAEKEEPSGHLPLEALQLARQCRPNRHGDTMMEVGSEYITLPNGWKLPRPRDIPPFPPIEKVIPADKPKDRLCFDAKYLYDCAKAIGSNQIVLEIFEGEHKPFVIRPVDREDKAFAVLMPCRINQ